MTTHVLLSVTVSPVATRAAIPAPISLPRAAVLRLLALSSDAVYDMQTTNIY